MLCVALKSDGGTKNGLAWEILLNVPPFANPEVNAVFAAAAWSRMLPETPGVTAPGPTKNWLYSGGLFKKLSATVPGKKS